MCLKGDAFSLSISQIFWRFRLRTTKHKFENLSFRANIFFQRYYYFNNNNNNNPFAVERSRQ